MIAPVIITITRSGSTFCFQGCDCATLSACPAARFNPRCSPFLDGGQSLAQAGDR